MKKNIFFLSLALVIIISMILVGCSSTPSSTPPPSTSAPAPQTSTSAPAKTTAPAPATTSAPPATTSSPGVITLKYNEQNPAAGWGATHASKPWLDQVTKATNGRVQFDTYFDATLTKGSDAWEATKSGTDDVAWMFHGYWAGMTPLADAMTLPLLPFASAKQASGIFWQLFQKYPTLAAEFKDNHVLVAYASSPYFLLTAKKQVKTMDDIKGLKIRTSAGPPVDMLKLLGAVPVVMGMADTYLDLQKGVIDGVAAPWEAVLSFRLFEVAKYYTYVPLNAAYFSVAMNNKKWDSLPRDIQDEINSVSGLTGSQFWGENFFDTVATAGRDQVKAKGADMVEYTLPQSELDKWTAIAGKPVWDQWVKNMTAQGHPEAQDILNTTLDLAKTYKP